MTKLFTRAVRRTAAGAALALVATGTALVAAPAGAASPLAYNCDSPQLAGDPYVVTAVIDTNAPATLGSGLSANITTTATLTLPAGLADELRGFGVSSVDGNATTRTYGRHCPAPGDA